MHHCKVENVYICGTMKVLTIKIGLLTLFALLYRYRHNDDTLLISNNTVVINRYPYHYGS